MSDRGVKELTNNTMSKLKDMVDANTVIGDPITTPDGTVVIPVSKIQVGFVSGGVDFNEKQPDIPDKGRLGGGSGGGVMATPLAFIVVSSDGGVKLMQIAEKNNTADRALNLVPDLINQITKLLGRKKDESGSKGDSDPDSDVVVEIIE